MLIVISPTIKYYVLLFFHWPTELVLKGKCLGTVYLWGLLKDFYRPDKRLEIDVWRYTHVT